MIVVEFGGSKSMWPLTRESQKNINTDERMKRMLKIVMENVLVIKRSWVHVLGEESISE
jgi:hypothetical protein